MLTILNRVSLNGNTKTVASEIKMAAETNKLIHLSPSTLNQALKTRFTFDIPSRTTETPAARIS